MLTTKLVKAIEKDTEWAEEIHWGIDNYYKESNRVKNIAKKMIENGQGNC